MVPGGMAGFVELQKRRQHLDEEFAREVITRASELGLDPNEYFHEMAERSGKLILRVLLIALTVVVLLGVVVWRLIPS